jgi:hypothetical protein
MGLMNQAHTIKKSISDEPGPSIKKLIDRS